jgi:hypothetical protein
VGYGWKEFAHAKPFEIGQPQRWVQFAHSHHEFFCFFDPSRPNIIPPSKSGLLVDSWAASAMPDRRRQKGLRGRVLQTPDAIVRKDVRIVAGIEQYAFAVILDQCRESPVFLHRRVIAKGVGWES